MSTSNIGNRYGSGHASRRGFMKTVLASTAAMIGMESLCIGADALEDKGAPDKVKGMYIDIHVHACAWGEDGFNLEGVSEWMEANRVLRCIIQYGVPSPGTEQEKRKAVENFKEYRGRIFPFCLIEPSDVATKAEAVKILRKMKADGAIGFGEHYGKKLTVNDPKCMRLYEACAEVGLPVLFHMDGGNNKDEPGLPHLEKALKANPKCIFIGHGPGWWANIRPITPAGKKAGPASRPSQIGAVDRLLARYPNMYGDLSAGSGARAIGRDKAFGRAFLIRHADKLMFGTDFGSWSYGKAPAPQFTLFESLDLPADVKAKIYRDNANRLFKFKDS